MRSFMDGTNMSDRNHEESTDASHLARTRTHQGACRFPQRVLWLILSMSAMPAFAASSGDTSWIFLIILVLVMGGVLLLSTFLTSIFSKRVAGKNYVSGVFYFVLWSSVLAVVLFWVMAASSGASDLFGGFLIVVGLLAAGAVLYATLHSHSTAAEEAAKRADDSLG